MEWIPYQKITITTDLSKKEVIERLQEAIGARPLGAFAKVQRKIFSGRLVEDKFDLSLNKDYMNSWTPEVTGTITTMGKLTELNVTLKSNYLVVGFTAIFIMIGLTVLVYEIMKFTDLSHFDLIALVFTVFPYGLCWFGFNLDADKSIDGLLKITKGTLE